MSYIQDARCLKVKGEMRSATHRLWSLGCWSDLNPRWGHGSILIQLQKSDPIFSMGVEIMTPAFNLEPKCSVIMFTREECNRGNLQKLKSSSCSQFVPEQWRGPGL